MAKQADGRRGRTGALVALALGAAAAWVDYRGPWVLGNHVRSLAAIAGSALLVVSLVRGSS